MGKAAGVACGAAEACGVVWHTRREPSRRVRPSAERETREWRMAESAIAHRWAAPFRAHIYGDFLDWEGKSVACFGLRIN